MAVTIFLLLLSAFVIYLSCETFVNGVEWLGKRLSISQTATGTILAAFGTALPESVVTLVATAFSVHDSQKQIGVGAALGGPLVLSTLAYAIVGIALLMSSKRLGRPAHVMVEVDGRRLSRDQAWFLAIFVCKVGLGLIAFAWKPWLGLLFLAAYAAYFWTEMRSEGGEEEGKLAPLKIRPHTVQPALGWIVFQTLVAMILIFVASRIFVGRLEAIGPWLGLSPQVTALLLSPIATELPETMNALIWVRQGKERLALANISGAMMIQATIPTAFGLFFTSWLLDRPLLVAAAVTTLAICILFLAFRRHRVSGRRLAQIGWLYLAFCVISFYLR